MAAGRILRITVTAVQIAALKAHEDLTAAHVFPLPLNGGKDFNQIFFHA
jgi:hypothetical protein